MFGKEIVHNLADAFRNIFKCLIAVSPASNGQSIRGQHLKSTKRSIDPISRTQENWNNTNFFHLMTLDSMNHFLTIAIVRVKKIRTDQQEDHMSALQMGLNFSFPFCTSTNCAIVPNSD